MKIIFNSFLLLHFVESRMKLFTLCVKLGFKKQRLLGLKNNDKMLNRIS